VAASARALAAQRQGAERSRATGAELSELATRGAGRVSDGEAQRV
jgi:hypothetical protein